MIKKENLTTSAFYERFSALADERIWEILQNQKDYQEAARIAATQIAIERGLIHSVDDLMAPEFQNFGNPKHTFFPTISNEYHRNRLAGSLYRFLFVFSLLPLIYGVLQYAKGDFTFAFLGVGAAAVWFFLVLLLKRTQKSLLVYPLLLLVLLVGIFFGVKIAGANPFRFMDIFILAVGVLLPGYFLLYIRKLIDSI